MGSIVGEVCSQASSGATSQVNTCGKGGDTPAKEDCFINGQGDQALLGFNSKGTCRNLMSIVFINL